MAERSTGTVYTPPGLVARSKRPLAKYLNGRKVNAPECVAIALGLQRRTPTRSVKCTTKLPYTRVRAMKRDQAVDDPLYRFADGAIQLYAKRPRGAVSYLDDDDAQHHIDFENTLYFDYSSEDDVVKKKKLPQRALEACH